jgi:hypothetical protein
MNSESRRSALKRKGHTVVDVCHSSGVMARHTLTRGNVYPIPNMYWALRKVTWGGLFPALDPGAKARATLEAAEDNSPARKKKDKNVTDVNSTTETLETSVDPVALGRAGSSWLSDEAAGRRKERHRKEELAEKRAEKARAKKEERDSLSTGDEDAEDGASDDATEKKLSLLKVAYPLFTINTDKRDPNETRDQLFARLGARPMHRLGAAADPAREAPKAAAFKKATARRGETGSEAEVEGSSPTSTFLELPPSIRSVRSDSMKTADNGNVNDQAVMKEPAESLSKSEEVVGPRSSRRKAPTRRK